MKIVTLVPRKPEPSRDALWAFTKDRWETQYPDYPIHVGADAGEQFNRSLAINRASDQAGDWDVAIILDADVVCEPRAIESAIRLTKAGHLAIAGDRRVHLTTRATKIILDGDQGDWERKGFVERIYHEHWSSCVVVSRELWDAVEGFDPLFVGWGYEDDAFRCACETMSDLPMVKVSGTIWHLWHPTNSHAVSRRTNNARAARYWAARYDREATSILIKERQVPTVQHPATRIPRILHRTVPENTSEEIEQYWAAFQSLHPGWEFYTYREPIDPNDWPITGRFWAKCKSGAQKAGLIRLEALYTHGGVYVDSDTQPLKSMEPLLHSPAFAAWEDETTIPDAILGSEPGHPAFKEMLELAVAAIQRRRDAWQSGPGVSTTVLSKRDDVLVLPPGAFYPHHYLQKTETKAGDGPWVFCRHMWAGSWLNERQKQSITNNQRVARAVR